MAEEQKKYGDRVIVVLGKAELNALVITSTLHASPQASVDLNNAPVGTLPLVEHITAIYLDPTKASIVMGGSAIDAALAKAIGIPPYVEGRALGWKEEEPVLDEVTVQANHELGAALVEAQEEIKKLNAILNQGPEDPPAHPPQE